MLCRTSSQLDPRLPWHMPRHSPTPLLKKHYIASNHLTPTRIEISNNFKSITHITLAIKGLSSPKPVSRVKDFSHVRNRVVTGDQTTNILIVSVIL